MPRVTPERSTQEQIGALVDERLLRALSEQFPDRCPPRGMPLEEIHRAAGAADVVRYLAECMKQARAL